MSTEEWRAIFRNSHGLKDPLVVKDPPTLPIANDEITSMFRGLSESTDPYKWNYLRGYIEGREDYNLPELFVAKLSSEQTCFEVIEACFGERSIVFGKQAGLIVNGGLQWSAMLQDAVHPVVASVGSLYPDSHFTFDLTFFIGAYGATPFGVHIDDDSHRTILFNLGPNPKGIAIWNNEEIYRQFGKVSNITDPNAIEARPEKFFFSAGEAFVLPSTRYHVGLNSTLSTSVALVIDLVDKARSLKQELTHLFSPTDSIGQEAPIENLMRLRASDIARLAQSRTRSNCHLRYPIELQDAGRIHFSPQTKLCRRQEFACIVEHFSDFGVFFGRGRHFFLPSALKTEGFTDVLLGKVESVESVIAELGTLTSDLRTRIKVLMFLLQAGIYEFET